MTRASQYLVAQSFTLPQTGQLLQPATEDSSSFPVLQPHSTVWTDLHVMPVMTATFPTTLATRQQARLLELQL
jgi:hypothetical protein